MSNLTIIPSINHASPPFPATAILFSKNAGNSAFEIIRFDDQHELDKARVMTIAAVRVLLRPADLDDVNKVVLKNIFNLSRPDFPVSEFPDSDENRALVIRLAREAATPYKESSMSDTNETATGTATPSNKTEAKAAERAAAKAAKQAEKDAAKAKREEERGNGVIGTIKKALDTAKGTTQDEVLDELVKKFPNRTRDGMASTVKIQFSRLAKSTGREIHNANIEGRGRVYKFKDQGEVPGKIVQPTAPAAATSTAAAPVAEGGTPASAGNGTGATQELAAGAPAAGGKKGGKAAAK